MEDGWRGDDRAEEWSAIGDGGPAAVSLRPDVGGKHFHIFESSQLEDSYAGDLPYPNWINAGPSHIYSLLILIFLCLIGRCALPSRVVFGILVQRSEKTFHTTIP